ncbi:MAG: VOC family protein [Candidatus Binatus sp.]|uniref:VOC family protein n=1 Tax=Candidatus Binatus sp. TaxID=2811406 RepID=UPI002726F1AC|nr:VOC family protein [Candidatus Binatus sp.]MDO8433743.1 VOC family protein [Candidatus Binatus sp.]
MIESIFHVNVNCTDFARSMEFYAKLGFKVVRDLEVVGNPELSAGLRIPDGRGRAVLLMLGNNRRATRLDLIEWLHPKTAGTSYPNLWNAGICRIALRTRDLRKDYAALKAQGIEFWTEPSFFNVREGREEGFVCCSDPDGAVIELIQV